MEKISLLSVLLFVAIITSFGQTNYYVSTTGNNNNSGTSTNQAWQSIQYSANNVLPGDTINIMAGTYNEKIDLTVSGSADNYITFKNYDSQNVILSGTSLPAYEYIMKIENTDYIRVSGLKFQNYQQLDAIGLIIINSSNLYIENNEFSNIDYSTTAVGETPSEEQNSQPIIVFGRDETVPAQNLFFTQNSIHDCETGWSEALSINGNIDGFEIGHNHLYNNTNIGIVAIGHEGECPTALLDQARNGRIHHNNVHDNPSAYAECAGIYVDGASQIIVENNTLYNNNYGIEVGCENNGNAPNDPSANNILVRNNIIYNNTYTGIALGGYDYPSSGKVEYAVIENNTCFNNDTENNYQGEMMISYTENSTIENNIFYTNNTDHVLFTCENGANTLLLNYNLYYTSSGEDDIVIDWNGTEYNIFADYRNALSQDINSLFSDPLFANNSTTNPDLHIKTNSPAKNTGNPVFQVTDGLDIDEEARIGENLVDIGADEYYFNTAIFTPNEKHKILCYPNPTNGLIGFEFANVSTLSSASNIQQITISNICGEIILTKSDIQKSKTIDLSGLESGIYIVNVYSGDEIFTSKIVKE